MPRRTGRSWGMVQGTRRLRVRRGGECTGAQFRPAGVPNLRAFSRESRPPLPQSPGSPSFFFAFSLRAVVLYVFTRRRGANTAHTQMGRPTHEAPTRVSTHTNTHTPWQAGGPQATAPCSNRHHASCLSAPTSLLRLLALAAPLVGLRVPITWCGKALDRALAPGGAAASARAGG